MKITKEYEAEQEKCVQENSDYYYNKKIADYVKARLDKIKSFLGSDEKTISIGCAGYEPIYLNTSHAVDIVSKCYTILREHGYKGEFFCCSCDAMPFPDKFFDCAVCSETIEHLPELDDVRRTFLEVDRVAKRWIFTTPNVDKIAQKWQYPGHKHFWNEETLKKIMPPVLLERIRIFTEGIYIFIEGHS